MESVLFKLTKIVSRCFEECGYESKFGGVSVSNRPDLCQFQCNGSFAATKEYKKAPVAIAGEVAQRLEKEDIVKSAQAQAPGFINITLCDDYLAGAVNDTIKDENLGIPQINADKTILLDYGGPNVAKPLHIGHLRSAIIGESLKRIVKATGGNTVADVHLGDWGLQIGLVIAELMERNPELSKNVDINLSADGLNEIYPFASQKSKTDAEFKEKARHITAELQGGNPVYLSIWKEIMRVSLDDLKLNYSNLGVNFDYWYGESDAEQYVPELEKILNDRNLLKESDGAMVVDISEDEDKAPMPPVIIKKSDNSNIYATTDLATIIQRKKDFNPDMMWYIVDKRQGLHFTQVFRCAYKAGLSEGTVLEHLGFGTMNGSDGKPYKTRDGGVMRLSDLISTVTDAAYEKMLSAGSQPGDSTMDTASKIAAAAIKFGDLSNHRMKDYVFDMDKFLSFEGKTGTYLIYTVTRINSILRKAGVSPETTENISAIYSDIERDIVLCLLLSGEAFRSAAEEKAPNFICDNAYNLASLFSAFYHDTHIINEQNEQKKKDLINLCIAVRKMLVKHLDVLGIRTVESM